jgi:hypothetical protein
VEGAGHAHLADAAAADELTGLAHEVGRAAVDADLRDAVVPPRGVHHAPPLDHAQRQRLFDVDVLARLAGVDGLQGVPVVGGADDHGVHVLALQQPAVVAELPRVGADLAGGEVEVGLVEVADGDHLGVALGEEGVEDLVAAVAQADEAQADAVIRPEDLARRQGGPEGGRGSGFRKVPTGGVLHRSSLSV